ncbi:MAG TPA: NUDIX domain-containing protein [Jatrophihabitans sp.]|nr:NUDIX domain-containing protein [Jatrophihabitans sp.]
MSGAAQGRATPAGGGVLWRQDGSRVLVAVVHRPRYDDWTLPKGKLHPGEHPLVAAVREVEEETGAQVEVGRRLPSAEYPFGDAIKQVSYWVMRYRGGQHTAGDEVDRLRWATVAEATQQLSYPVDRGVLADFARLPSATRTLLLLRHAKAGKRSAYSGDDRLRPLDKAGRRQAHDSVAVLAAFNPQRVLAADRARCEQSVQPLADHLGLEVRSVPALSDEAYAKDPDAGLAEVRELLEQPGTTLICSQGETIPALLEHLRASGAPYPARKGSVWALSVADRGVVAADYYPQPYA